MSNIFGSEHTNLVGVARAGRAVLSTEIDNVPYDLLANTVQIQAQEQIDPMMLPAEPDKHEARVLLIGQLATAQVQIGSLVGDGVEDFISLGASLEGMPDRSDLEIMMFNTSVNTGGEMVSLERAAKFTIGQWKIINVGAQSQAGGGEPLANFSYSIFALNCSFELTDTPPTT